MTEQKPNSPAKNALVGPVLLYGLFVFGYGLYETMTARGIAGYLIARQMEWFDSASLAVTYCVDLVILTVPLFLLAIVYSPVSDALWGMLLAGTPHAPGSAPAAPQPAPQGLTWTGTIKASLFLFGLTAAIAGVVYLFNVREHSLGVYKVNLDAAETRPPGRLGFIQVTGHSVGSLGLTYTDRSTVSLIVPITSSSWTPAQPLRYFVHYHQLGSSREQLTPPDELRKPSTAIFGGEVERKLPTFVERAYTAKGLKLDPNYQVIDWQQLTPGEAPMSQSHLMVLGIGGLISGVLSLLLVLGTSSSRKSKR